MAQCLVKHKDNLAFTLFLGTLVYKVKETILNMPI
jgi:hypothetical protein